MENLFLDPTLILLIAAFAGFFMAFGIGANDVANAMGTSVGSKAITFKQAILLPHYLQEHFHFLFILVQKSLSWIGETHPRQQSH